MTTPPPTVTRNTDGARLVTIVDRVTMRVTWIAATEGAAAGLLVAALVLALVTILAPERLGSDSARAAWSLAVAAGCAIVGALVQLARTPRTAASSAARIERGLDASRNVVFTANELARAEPGTSASNARAGDASPVATLVFAEAERALRGLQLPTLLPARNALVALAAGVLVHVLIAARDSLPLRSATRMVRAMTAPRVPRIDDVVVTVTTPSYAGRTPVTSRNPARVEALAGSTLSLRVDGNGDSVLVETLRGTRRVGRGAGRSFEIVVLAETDGFIALTPLMLDGGAGEKRLIGLSVTADEAPRVRITAPGRDLFLRDSSYVIDVAIESDDDLALQSLRLRYTKVSGSGERFTFTDGEVPLQISRDGDRAWTARARWPLAPLGLSPGDMVVYRAVATDRRPGATAQESDALIAEIVSVGSDAAAGFAIDADQERYAISQQMIVIKTERLIARRATMPPDSITRAAQELAAEQRKVRAEFVFMMGGELADEPSPEASMDDLNEEAEAEAEDDILAGRLANQGRMALMRAIRAMSRAATELTNGELTGALVLEKSAVTQLELAFARTRILLRALNERESLDETRRLTGTLTDARSDRRQEARAVVDPRRVALRSVLAELAAASGGAGETTGRLLPSLAQSILRVDPSSDALQKVSRQVSDAARAFERGRRDEGRSVMDSAVVALAAFVKQELPRVGATAPTFEARRLRGALVDRERDR